MEALELLKTNLSDVFSTDNIGTSSSNGEYRILLSNYKYCIDFRYNIVDNFYSIRFESKIENKVYFLTQSKEYHSYVKKALRKKRLESDKLDNHITVFIEIVKDYIKCGNISEYNRDLKFDGLFL